MSFLFQRIDGVREIAPESYRDLPPYIRENLNPEFEMRPYQENAFRNFITHFEGSSCPKPTQVLFHMATGSGKTLIMAGLILYLYQRGYRNFLFFVNLDNIVKKTKDNFLNHSSAKFLFTDDILLNGEHVKINEVSNFQSVNSEDINICFTTTQGLHSDMWFHKENAPTFDDFREIKTVLIADEAHHLNADTRNGRLNHSEEENRNTWEETVTRIFEANRDNVLLEFTATCDLQNRNILAAYENKIIFNYPLKQFREDGYSKQVRAIRAAVPRTERVLQALMLSQYRLKVFQEHRLFIKPVVLFKAKTISESKSFEQDFYNQIEHLTGDVLQNILSATQLDEVRRMADYFVSHGISCDALAQELREEFSREHCISANDDTEAEKKQLDLNSLESKDNPYRAIFEVKKLDEGWDVLNLFDIVRLYETRDAVRGRPGACTISEAQLIGRGARYCPFKLYEEDEKFKRKYDKDIDNPLRVCEELYYHCQYDSRYIDELNKALIATGIMPDTQIDIHYQLKEEFKNDDFYRNGLVFSNRREVKSRQDVRELLPSVRSREYRVSINTGRMAMDTMMEEEHSNTNGRTYQYRTTIGGIAELNYSIVHSALRRINVFKFNILHSYFPNLRSIREFITEGTYLRDISVLIESREQDPSPETLFAAVLDVLIKIGNEISAIRKTYIGTTEFADRHFCEVFKNKTLHITDPHGEGEGISQNSPAIRPEWKLDLSQADWFVFNDNYGTTEEKAFVAYFAAHVEELRRKYEKVYLIRNERQLVLYSFDAGERFEPDYLLILCKRNATGYDQYQVFVEPKGSHLLLQDQWKEDFLLQIKAQGIPTKTFVDDNQYHVWGLPFFNQDTRMQEFSSHFSQL